MLGSWLMPYKHIANPIHTDVRNGPTIYVSEAMAEIRGWWNFVDKADNLRSERKQHKQRRSALTRRLLRRALDFLIQTALESSPTVFLWMKSCDWAGWLAGWLAGCRWCRGTGWCSYAAPMDNISLHSFFIVSHCSFCFLSLSVAPSLRLYPRRHYCFLRFVFSFIQSCVRRVCGSLTGAIWLKEK